MKVIKWIIILIVIGWYTFVSIDVINACLMICYRVSVNSVSLSILGGLSVYISIKNFNKWFDSNLRTHNVKTNEENSNNPS